MPVPSAAIWNSASKRWRRFIGSPVADELRLVVVGRAALGTAPALALLEPDPCGCGRPHGGTRPDVRVHA